MKTILDVAKLVSEDGCFNLQFRKDTRHERTNAPTYYRWKAQFVITGPKDTVKVFQKVKKELGCGKVHLIKEQARLSVQNINDIAELIIPYFKKKQLSGNKKKDFELWQKSVSILHKNKGIYMAKWKKNDLLSLMQIHEQMAKYKAKPKQHKWISMARTMVQAI